MVLVNLSMSTLTQLSDIWHNDWGWEDDISKDEDIDKIIKDVLAWRATRIAEFRDGKWVEK